MQRDTQIFDLIQKERERQTKGIERKSVSVRPKASS